jgi:formamidopyrimidine-DNA glycosylase
VPELPEVETIRQTLARLVVGKTIEQVTVTLSRIIQHPKDIHEFKRTLCGQTIRAIGRRGKFLKFFLDRHVLVSHLRMEGNYGLYHRTDEMIKHTHVIFHFTDGSELRYKDVRQFGTMHLFLVGEEEKKLPLSRLGPEPFSLSPQEFASRVRARKSFIKPVLLNQEVVVGLGNIYADESLHDAGIHPLTPCDSLNDEQLNKLFASVKKILGEAIAQGGSSVKSYVNGQGEMGMFQQQLKVYRKTGQPCPNCGTAIMRIVVGGRGTHFCPQCQPSSSSR